MRVGVGVAVGRGVLVAVGVGVRVAVGIGVSVGGGVAVGVGVGVRVGTLAGVVVGRGARVGGGVRVGTGVGVAVGGGKLGGVMSAASGGSDMAIRVESDGGGSGGGRSHPNMNVKMVEKMKNRGSGNRRCAVIADAPFQQRYAGLSPRHPYRIAFGRGRNAPASCWKYETPNVKRYTDVVARGIVSHSQIVDNILSRVYFLNEKDPARGGVSFGVRVMESDLFGLHPAVVIFAGVAVTVGLFIIAFLSSRKR